MTALRDLTWLRLCERTGCAREALQDGYVCPQCASDGLDRARTLPGLYAALRAAAVPSSGAREDTEVTSTAKPASRPPVNARTFDAAELVEATARQLDHAVRLATGRPPARHAGIRPAVLVVRATTDTIDAWPALLAQPFAPAMVERLSDVAQRARTALGLGLLVHRLTAPCPVCDALTLTRDNGASEVRCAACGGCWPATHYRALVLAQVADAGTAVRR